MTVKRTETFLLRIVYPGISWDDKIIEVLLERRRYALRSSRDTSQPSISSGNTTSCTIPNTFVISISYLNINIVRTVQGSLKDPPIFRNSLHVAVRFRWSQAYIPPHHSFEVQSSSLPTIHFAVTACLLPDSGTLSV